MLPTSRSMSTGGTDCQSVRRLKFARFLAAVLVVCSAGCTIFERPKETGASSSALSWFTNWVNQPLDSSPGFDIESIRPDGTTAAVQPGNLLEITVWDLDEPGKPTTFPVRVAADQTVEVPLLGHVSVKDQPLPQIESQLRERFVAGEYLVTPRVLVRSLDAPIVKVRVEGAVQRPGYVELTRDDTSVYTAILSAGGLKKNASAEVIVTRSERTVAPSQSPKSNAQDPVPAATLSEAPTQDESNASPASPELHANSLEPMSVETRKLALNEAHRTPGDSSQESVEFFNLLSEEHRNTLRTMQLSPGDTITVKSAAAPIRVGGIVEHPGAFPLPAGRSVNVWQAIGLAGGVKATSAPLNITLIRPAAEGRSAQRWSLNVESWDERPAGAPQLEPGDILHIAPTTGGKIKRAVGDLWNRS